jgi:hypothetical protein
VQILGGTLVVDEASISFDTAGMLNMSMVLGVGNVTVGWMYTNTSQLVMMSSQVAGPISPWNASLPFSQFWNDSLGQANVNGLDAYLVDSLDVAYLYSYTGDSFVMQGLFTFGDWDANLYLDLQQVDGNWTALAADIQLLMGNFLSVSINGSSPCLDVESAGVVVQNVGPFAQPAEFLGTVWLACNSSGYVTSYFFNATATNVPVSVLDAEEYVEAVVSFDSTTNILTLEGSGGNASWTIGLTMDVTVPLEFSLAVVTNASLEWSSVPFSSGLEVAFGQEAQIQGVVGLELSALHMIYSNFTSIWLNFSASVGEEYGNFSSGQGLMISMERVNATWNLEAFDFSFDFVYQIGGIGTVSVNGNLNPPAGTLDASLQLSGIPGVSASFGGLGLFSYQCNPGSTTLSYYNVSLTLSAVAIQIGSDVLNLQEVSVAYSNLTGLLLLSGTMVLQEAPSNVSANVAMSINVGGKSEIIITETIVTQVGPIIEITSVSVEIADAVRPSLISVSVGVSASVPLSTGLPLGNMVTSAVNASGPITPTTMLSNLSYVYNAGHTMVFAANIQDGPTFGGYLIVGLEKTLLVSAQSTWKFQVAQVQVNLGEYGNVYIEAMSPCNGSETMSAAVDLPMLTTSIAANGTVGFTCNGSSIMYYVAQFNASVSVALFGSQETFDATFEYASQFDSFQATATMGSCDVFLNYTGTTATSHSNYGFGFQIQQLTPFAEIPFADALGPLVDASNSTSSPLSSLDITYGELAYFGGGADETFGFAVDVQDSMSELTGTTNINLTFAFNGTGWAVTQADLGTSLLIDNIAQITLNVDPLCPSASGDIALNFNNLPLSVPQFSVGGSIQFGCSAGAINTSEYTLSAYLSVPIGLNFLGETITMENMDIAYSSLADVFNFTWVPDPNFAMTLLFGKGLKQEQASDGIPMILSATLINPADPPSLFNNLGSVLPSFGGSTSFVNPDASSGSNSVSSDLSHVELQQVQVLFNGEEESITVSAEIQIYSADAVFFVMASKVDGGNWGVVFGAEYSQGGGGSNITSPYTWMNNMIGSGSSLTYSSLFLVLCSQAGTYQISSGTAFQAMGPGLLIQSSLDLSCPPVHQISGGANSTANQAQGGAFGAGLSAASPNGFTLTAVMEITPSMFYLLVEMGYSITAYQNSGTALTEFVGVEFLIQIDLDSPLLSFQFAFTYMTTMGGDLLRFVGALGMQLGEAGDTVVATFGFNGNWVNPFLMSQYIDVTVIAMQISLDVAYGIPISVDLACTILLTDPVTASVAT